MKISAILTNIWTWVLLLVITASLVAAGIMAIVRLTKIPFISPAASRILSSIYTEPQTDYIIYGFLPYWLLKHEANINYELITHIAYFGIAIDEQGQIQTHLDDGTKELGLHRLQTSNALKSSLSRARLAGAKPILVIRAMSTDSIQAAVDPATKDELISEMLSTAQQYHFSGFNIDFEPTSDSDAALRQQVTDFVSQLTDACREQLESCHISIDVYSNVASNPRIWDLAQLSKIVDNVVVMGYDFHRTASPNAGPNAPLHGAPLRWKYDLNTTMANLIKIVPASKIILAVPYYGYEWMTLSENPGATAVHGTGRLATYARVKALQQTCIIQILSCEYGFDNDSLSPYLIYQLKNEWHQVWYDDPTSLQIKYQFAKATGFNGIGIWALGYEENSPELWELIKKEFYSSGPKQP